MAGVAAVILAGGRSTRMGRDKALLTVAGEPLLGRTSRMAQAAADHVYVVTPWPDRYRSLLPGLEFLAEVPLAGAADTDHGPLVGLTQAIAALSHSPDSHCPDSHGPERPDWVLALACDLPQLSAAVLGRWRQNLAQVDATALAYLPRRGDRWEPLCGFYRTAALASLQQYVSAGGRAFQPWLNRESVAAIALSPDEGKMLTNLNTPTDLAQWRRLHSPGEP